MHQQQNTSFGNKPFYMSNFNQKQIDTQITTDTKYYNSSVGSHISFVEIYDCQYYPQVKNILLKIYEKKCNANEILSYLNDFRKYTKLTQNSSVSRAYQQNEHRQFRNKQTKETANYQTYQKQITQTMLLSQYSQSQICTVFSKLATVILKRETQQRQSILMINIGVQKQAHLTKSQVLYLLALMSFNLVPIQNPKLKRLNKNNNFSFIFQNQQFKTKCIMEYLKRTNFNGKQVFTIRRKVQMKSMKSLINTFGDKKMIKPILKQDFQTIEDYVKDVKIDFANKFIGGGALTKGCVQEQIMFANHPEMFIATVLCQAMDQNQSLHFIGFKKYNTHKGYSYQTKYVGQQKSLSYEKDGQNRVIQYISAIDATQFKQNPIQQFKKDKIDRQIIKAYTGFDFNQTNRIVTGNWGCGAFNGNITLKFMIQWIASTMAEKQMIYCPYGKFNKLNQNKNKILELRALTVRQTYRILLENVEKIPHAYCDIFQYMQVPKIYNKNNKNQVTNTQQVGCFDRCQIY